MIPKIDQIIETFSPRIHIIIYKSTIRAIYPYYRPRVLIYNFIFTCITAGTGCFYFTHTYIFSQSAPQFRKGTLFMSGINSPAYYRDHLIIIFFHVVGQEPFRILDQVGSGIGLHVTAGIIAAILLI